MALMLEGSEIDGIIFDVDGTFYPQVVLRKVFADVRHTLAIQLLAIAGTSTPSEEQILQRRDSYVGLASKIGSFTRAYIQLGGNKTVYKQTAERVDRSQHLHPDRRLQIMLQELRLYTRIGILTSTLEETTENSCRVLFGNKWRGLFDVVACSDTPGTIAEKPHPNAFSYVLNELGTYATRTAMVGDLHGADIEPAASLGMITVQVENSDSPVARLKINNIHEFPCHIKFVDLPS